MKALFPILFGLLVSTSLADEQVTHILVQTEHIELHKKDFHSFLYGKNFEKTGDQLREELQKKVKAKTATIIDSKMINASFNETARAESVVGHIYAGSYDPVSITPTQITKEGLIVKGTTSPPNPTALEEVPVGSIFECTASFDEQTKRIAVELESKVNYRVKDLTYATWKGKLGEHNVTVPQFYSMKLGTSLSLKHNSYHLAGILTPKGKDGKADYGKKVLVFVRALAMKSIVKEKEIENPFAE